MDGDGSAQILGAVEAGAVDEQGIVVSVPCHLEFGGAAESDVGEVVEPLVIH